MTDYQLNKDLSCINRYITTQNFYMIKRREDGF